MTTEDIQQQLTDARETIRYLKNRKTLVLHGMNTEYTLEQCDHAITIWKVIANTLTNQLNDMEARQ